MPAITFLEPQMLRQWSDVSPILQEIVLYIIEETWPDSDHESGPPFVFTCIHRSPEENKRIGGYKWSPHAVGPPYRAVDARNRTLNDKQQATIVSKVNYRYIYDPTRPKKKVILNNDRWSTGPHLHIQVHPSTRLRCEAA